LIPAASAILEKEALEIEGLFYLFPVKKYNIRILSRKISKTESQPEAYIMKGKNLSIY
jgi:hypothetical protein